MNAQEEEEEEEEFLIATLESRVCVCVCTYVCTEAASYRRLSTVGVLLTKRRAENPQKWMEETHSRTAAGETRSVVHSHVGKTDQYILPNNSPDFPQNFTLNDKVGVNER